jgi:hypothetical protein
MRKSHGVLQVDHPLRRIDRPNAALLADPDREAHHCAWLPPDRGAKHWTLARTTGPTNPHSWNAIITNRTPRCRRVPPAVHAEPGKRWGSRMPRLPQVHTRTASRGRRDVFLPF